MDGYRFASTSDKLRVQLNINGNEGDFVSKIVMLGAGITTNTGEKSYVVGNAVGVSSISSNIITLQTGHDLIDGESIRVIGDNGFLPDGLEEDEVYFAITSGVSTNGLKVARTLNVHWIQLHLPSTALVEKELSEFLIRSGDIGHPVQFDTNNKNWYVNVDVEGVTMKSILQLLV